jgi:hypothetical protein
VSLPLQLDVEIVPASGRVGTPTTLLGRLSNDSGTAQLVNTRMLLNHSDAPGEVSIEVTGPAGWVNPVDFDIRVGAAGPEFFRELADGESVVQDWDLDRYLDLHAPGDYVITVTYRQESAAAPDGRPMATGTVSATVNAHRSAW